MSRHIKETLRSGGEESDLEEWEFEVKMNSTSGEARIFAWPMDEPDARKDVTPPGFGRIAAQTAKQVIHQKIREAEKGAIMDEYSERVGSLISGMVLRFDGSDVRIDLGKTEGVMPRDERVPTERLNPNQRMTFLLKEIVDTMKGKQLILTRSSAEFVQKLFAREVPEISSGSVEIDLIAREAGVRTKMAVSSKQSGVDPVGSCVGQKGVRVQAVTNELGGERVDIIQYTDDAADLIKAALSPAEDLSIKLDEENKIAVVKAPDEQLSVAIGREGQNVRLAAKLSKWKIEIQGDGSQSELGGDENKESAKTEEKKKEEKKKLGKKKDGEKEEKPKKTKKKSSDAKAMEDKKNEKVEPESDKTEKKNGASEKVDAEKEESSDEKGK